MYRLFFGVAVAAAVAFGNAAFAGGKPPAPQRVIVKFEGAAPGRAQVAEEVLAVVGKGHGVQFEKYLTLGTGAVSFWIRGSRSDEQIDRVIAALSRSPRVSYAERSQYWGALFSPDDTRFNEQWHYTESMGGINLPLAWDYSKGDGVVVAVVDTGIVTHADLTANVLPGYDMIVDTSISRDGNGRDSNPKDEGDWRNAGNGQTLCPPHELCDKNPQQSIPFADEPSSWHGTHVAGIVAALFHNNKGVAGVAPGARILPVRVLGKGGWGETEDIVDGILWAAGAPVWHGPNVPLNPNPAAVINLSLGEKSASCPTTYSDAIAVARSRGASVVVAAGNGALYSPAVQAGGFSPANCPDAITVAALNRQGAPANYASLGSVVDLAAPGGTMASETDPNGVLSTLNTGEEDPVASPAGDTYNFYQGSSMAAPQVAGVLALIRSVNPTFTVQQAEEHLLDTARTIVCSGCNNKMVDAGAAVSSGTLLPTVTLSLSGGSMVETGGSLTVTATLSGAYSRDVVVKLAFTGTAVAADYSASATSMTIVAGQTAASVTLNATHDTSVEGNETIVVDIDSASFANEAVPSQVTVTIADDDARLSFQYASYSKLENFVQNAAITVVRSGGMVGEVRVNYSRSGGSASPGNDFATVTTSGTLIFPANVASQTFQVQVFNDTTAENDETINFVLSAPTGGAVIGSPSSTVLTILCNDGYNCQ